jgi:Ferredoxin-like domain in Api92-like protein
MPLTIINHLRFRTNSETILNHIKSQGEGDQSPAVFSLNSIKPTPQDLILPMIEPVRTLSVMNSPLQSLDKETMALAQANVFFGIKSGRPKSEIQDAIQSAKETVANMDKKGERDPLLPDGTSATEILEKAVVNYEQAGVFSHYDWRLKSWGTIEDIQAVNESTFKLPSFCIEFQTAWTPPVAALQILSNTFPSVRFELDYHLNPEDPLITVEFFPFPPFGY